MTPTLLPTFSAARRRALVLGCVAALAFIPEAGSGQAAPPIAGAGWESVFRSYMRGGKTDSALAVLHRAVASGDSAVKVPRFALRAGNELYRRGSASKNVDTLMAAILFFAYGDSLIPSDPAKVLIAASHVTIGMIAEGDAVQAKSCKFAKVAQSNWRQALADQASYRDLTDEGLRFDSVRKMVPVVDSEVAAYCR